MPRKPTKSGNRDASGACRVPVAIPSRGAPRGNTNALRHGGASARSKARRAEIRALVAQANETVAWVNLLAAALRAGGPEAVVALSANRAIDAPVTSAPDGLPPYQKSTVYSVTSRKSH